MAWELFGPRSGRDEDKKCHASPLADRLFSPPGLVDGAVQRVTNQLARRATDWVVSDSDAREAAQALASLPPALQGQAVSRLDPPTLERLMHELPEAERQQLTPLSDHCEDPARKLQLFAVSHTSQVKTTPAVRAVSPVVQTVTTPAGTPSRKTPARKSIPK